MNYHLPPPPPLCGGFLEAPEAPKKYWAERPEKPLAQSLQGRGGGGGAAPPLRLWGLFGASLFSHFGSRGGPEDGLERRLPSTRPPPRGRRRAGGGGGQRAPRAQEGGGRGDALQDQALGAEGGISGGDHAAGGAGEGGEGVPCGTTPSTPSRPCRGWSPPRHQGTGGHLQGTRYNGRWPADGCRQRRWTLNRGGVGLRNR